MLPTSRAQISANIDCGSFLTIVLWVLNEKHNSIELKGILFFKHNLSSLTVNLCICSASFLACYKHWFKILDFSLVASCKTIYYLSFWDLGKRLPPPLPHLLPYSLQRLDQISQALSLSLIKCWQNSTLDALLLKTCMLVCFNWSTYWL